MCCASQPVLTLLHALTFQEEEKLLKPNTAKSAVFLVLKAVGVEGASAEEIQALSTEKGFKTDWAPSSLNFLKTVRSSS